LIGTDFRAKKNLVAIMLHSYAATNFQSFLDRVEVDLVCWRRPKTEPLLGVVPTQN
jgi:hypothetical protein